MNQIPLHPDVLEFVSSLERLHDILSSYGYGIWAEKIARVQKIAESSDGYCIDLFLELYGGMGSFNDLVLNAPSAVNEIFDTERRHAYALAAALK